MAAVPVASTVPLIKTNEDSKDRLLFTLQIAVKQIQHCTSLQNSEKTLSFDVHEVKQLCESLDKALFHGLKCFDNGYWSFVKEFSHKNTIQYLQELKNVQTHLQCGRAWLCLAINEASLESYFRSFMQNIKFVRKYYETPALLCDEQRMQLVLMLMAGLEFVPINIELEKMHFGNGLSFFESQPVVNPLVYASKSLNSPTDESQAENTNNYELVNFDHAVEVTSDFKDSIDLNLQENATELKTPGFMHKPKADLNCHSTEKTISAEELEKISRYISIDSERDTKLLEDLEVIRTKVVRRIKRSSSQTQNQGDRNPVKDSKAQPGIEVSTIQENRLSKATTDSGLFLETPYSSDSEFSNVTDDVGTSDEGVHIFDVGDFCPDISVTFIAPKTVNFDPTKSCPHIEERGVPEGQEDPQVPSSDSTSERQPLQAGNDGLDPKDEDFEEEEELSIYDLCKVSTSAEESSIMELKAVKPENPLSCDIDIKSISSESSQKSIVIDVVSEELAKLALEKPQEYDLKVGNNYMLYFLVEVYEHEEETFYKLYCGYSCYSEGSSQRVYFLLSNKGAYFLKPGNSEQKFFKLGGLRYSSIDYIIVDLNYQSFKVFSSSRECYSLCTGDAELTREILSNLEIGIRRFIPKLPLPTVYTDATVQMIMIRKFLATVFECERASISLDHYVLARWEDYSTSSVTPTGPLYGDYLMYRHVFAKEKKATAWQSGYFLLKEGVLHCMENEISKPLFSIQMCAPHCKGCRRIHLKRPHAFEIYHSKSDTLQLAATDDYEASKWLQCFLETVSLAGHFIDAERSAPEPCCIMLANDMIVISREEPRKGTYKLLNKANLSDLVTIFVDPIASSFVMLEFEVAEAGKSSGEWILSFESLEEKEKFIEVLCLKWYQIYQVKLSVENFKDIYLLKKYRGLSEEIKAERRDFENFCADC